MGTSLNMMSLASNSKPPNQKEPDLAPHGGCSMFATCPMECDEKVEQDQAKQYIAFYPSYKRLQNRYLQPAAVRVALYLHGTQMKRHMQ